MNITKYRLELDENRHNILVRESDTEYDGGNFNDPLAVAEMLKNNYRLHERQEMIRQANVYRENRECYVQYKKTKPRKQLDFAERHRTELALYSHAEQYLLAHAADRKVTLGAWKADAARLSSEKDRLYDEMCGLRNAAKEASAVMRDVKRVMQPEQPQRRHVKGQDMEFNVI